MMNNSKPPIHGNLNTRKALLLRIAWLYYFEGLTQGEIGQRLGFSRVSINRMLKEARESKLVEIKLNAEGSYDAYQTSETLIKKYGLKEVFIARDEPAEDPFIALAEAGGAALSQYARQGMTIGVGFGRSLVRVPEFFLPREQGPFRFVSLIGGLDFSLGVNNHSFDILSMLAQKSVGQSVYIPAPILVNSPETRQLFLDDKTVQHSLDVAASADLAIFSVGEMSASSLLYQLGMMSPADLEELRRLDAKGDLLGRYYGADGKELDLKFNQRVIGLSVEEVAALPLSILVAGGEQKTDAVRAALQGKLCKVLVTDLKTAVKLTE